MGAKTDTPDARIPTAFSADPNVHAPHRVPTPSGRPLDAATAFMRDTNSAQDCSLTFPRRDVRGRNPPRLSMSVTTRLTTAAITLCHASASIYPTRATASRRAVPRRHAAAVTRALPPQLRACLYSPSRFHVAIVHTAVQITAAAIPIPPSSP